MSRGTIASIAFFSVLSLFVYNGCSHLDHALNAGSLQVGHWGCLNQVEKIGHSRNVWTQLNYPSVRRRRDKYLAGGTIWINEHMAIGHAQYDVVIMEVLRYANVSRIILQRSPCLTPLLCHGIGTWKAWYAGYYAAMINAFRPGIPIYIRWGRTSILTAHYLSVNETSGLVDEEVRENDTIPLRSTDQCFETVWRRTECAACVQSAVSLSTARLFQQSAIKLIANRGDIFKNAIIRTGNSSSTTIRILHAYRSASSSRHIKNIETLQLFLSSAFNSSVTTNTTSTSTTITTTTPSIAFLSLPTPESNYQEQIQMVSSADILITEHGAFQSNMVFMRCGSAVVDLRGSYWGREKGSDRPILYAEAVAKAFGLQFSHVVMSKLSQHSTKSFPVTKGDMDAIVRQVKGIIAAMSSTSGAGKFNQHCPT